MKLDRESWLRLEPIVDQALELPEAERSAYLDEACSGDPELRREVDELLRAEAGSADLLEHPAVSVLEPSLSTWPERIGPYRVLEEIGRGGMSEVLLAERGAPYTQRVALKLMRPPSGDGAEAARRFRAERQILAGLDHPAIARILDGGETGPLAEGGRPYLVMEYIEGEGLTEYADARGLSIDQRLDLALQVCDAVQFAHQRLVVHRDLKPANILVTGEGQVKLLDFGIAKLLDPHAVGSETIAPTRQGVLLMTPEYAAPEQLLGGEITTATDVYGLGLVLYELIAGGRPYELAGKPPSEIQELICERLPPAPSSRLASPGGRADLADLDSIVLRALAKEPERRYASVADLAADLRRYRASEPIAARPPALGYRARLFVRRHRAGVAAAVAFVALLAAAALALVAQQAETTRERDRARQEADKSEQVAELLLSLFEAGNPANTGGEEVTARQLLDRGVERLDGWAGDPDTEAELRHVIGRAYHTLGEYPRGEELLRRALELRAPPAPVSARASPTLSLAAVLRDRGEFLAAADLARELATDLEGELEPDRELIAAAVAEVGLSLLLRRDYEEAEPFIQRGLALREEFLPADSPQIADSLNDLAIWLTAEERYEEADALYERVLAMTRRAHGDTHPDVAASLDNRAQLKAHMGDFEAAERLFLEGLEMKHRMVGEDHPLVAATLSNLGVTMAMAGELERSAGYLERALAVSRRSLPAGSAAIGRSLYNLGGLQLQLGEPAAAEPLLRESLPILEAVYGPESSWVAFCTLSLGEALTARGAWDEARDALLRAVEIRLAGDDATALARARRALAELYDATGATGLAAEQRAAIAAVENASPEG